MAALPVEEMDRGAATTTKISSLRDHALAARATWRIDEVYCRPRNLLKKSDVSQ